MELHKAKIIITNNGDPIFDAAVLVDKGKILAINNAKNFNGEYKIYDHENSIICPGFINLHTHLNYTDISGISGHEGLFIWIKELLKITKHFTNEDFIKSSSNGILEALATGTTFLVENTPNEHSIKALEKSKIKSLIGIEIFGNDESSIKNKLKECKKLKDKYPSLNFTLSPHAPYNVGTLPWKKILEWSKKNQSLILTHLNESKDESKWWLEKKGRLLDLWKYTDSLDNKIKNWTKYNSGVDYLEKNSLLSSNLIGTHFCESSENDLEKVKKSNIKLVHCPRSNYYFNHTIPNLKTWDELNIPWGIGTDSKASNNDLSLLNELRFTIEKQNELYSYEITPQKAFEHITFIPSKILNKEGQIGVLKENSCCDFIVFKLNDTQLKENFNPYKYIIFDIDTKKNLKEVWIDGNIVYSVKNS